MINPHNELALPKKNTPRDVFLHLLAMVTLYWSAISFITLCWQYINYFFPDALNYYNSGYSIRFAVSSLFIVFPIFLLVSWFLNRIYTQESGVRESKIRKWLIYLTLFIASLVIIGDLIVVINTFLNGEITIRFVLKAFSILLVAGAILGYYLDDVRRSTPSPLAKLFGIGAAIVVVIAIIGAFFIIGSPMQARQEQFDQQRVSDLQGIQYQVVNYWQRKEMLPATLTDVNDPISSYMIPSDPQTGKAYEYRVVNASTLTFELCAEFGTAVRANNLKPTTPFPSTTYSENFDHEAGRVCFERTIDPQLYPPLVKGK